MVHISDIRVGVGEVEESSFSTGQILAGVGGLVDYLVGLSLVTDLEAESVRRNVLPTDTKPVSGRHRKKTEVS